MRKYQISIQVNDFEHDKVVMNGFSDPTYEVYSDANDFYSALLNGINELSRLYAENNGHTLGRCEGSARCTDYE